MTLHLKYCPHKIQSFEAFWGFADNFQYRQQTAHSNLEPTVQPIVSPFFLCTIRRCLTIAAGRKQKDSQIYYLHTISLVFFTSKVCFDLNIGHQIIQTISSVVSHF